MTKRWIISGVAVVTLLAATAGIAYAAGSGSGPSGAQVPTQMIAAMDAMHDSPGMEAMHENMPAALQARCDAMHAAMESMMGSSGMMDGSAMTKGAATTGGSMADHHSSTEG